MFIGMVKWFNNAKGYGFVCTQDEKEDIFVHFSSIQMEGYKTLKAGQKVTFELNRGSKGLHALNIQAYVENDGAVGEACKSNHNEELASASLDNSERSCQAELSSTNKTSKKEADLFVEAE